MSEQINNYKINHKISRGRNQQDTSEASISHKDKHLVFLCPESSESSLHFFTKKIKPHMRAQPFPI